MKLKGNCRRLYPECQRHVATHEPTSVVETTERTRGRTERRRVEVYTPPAWQADWPALGAVVQLTRSGEREGRAYERVGLYVTSHSGDAAALGEVIRQHWHVENRLHWVKDVLMQEDTGGVRSKRGASVLALLRSAALSAARWGGDQSWTEARARWTNRVPEMLALMRS